METQIPNLAALGIVSAPEAAGEQVPRNDEDKALQALTDLMDSVNSSLANQTAVIAQMKAANQRMAFELRKMQGRMSSMETFVSYLLMENPNIADRMNAMAAAAEAAEKAEAAKVTENPNADKQG
jgi:hypothetical protein